MSCWVSLLPILLLFTDHVISEGCGRPKEFPVMLISHGVNSSLGLWPWHVAVMHGRKRSTAEYSCGGTIISSSYILTAAHCTYTPTREKLSPRDIFIRAGISKLQLSEKHSLQDVAVREIVSHEGYQKDTAENDIALLKVKKKLILTDYVKPICLWKDAAEEKLIVGKRGVVAGWGKDEHGKLSDQLQYAAMPIVSREQCRDSDPDYYTRYLFDRKTFCAGDRNGTSPGLGDSGGGFYIDNKKRWFLRGIVSNGKFDRFTQQLDTSEYIVFTDIAYFEPWINQKTEMDECGQRRALLPPANNKSESSLGEWPWHAAVMQRITRKSFKYACGGTIISSSYILTAAYCIYYSLTSKGHVEPSDIFIRAGITYLNKQELFQQQIEVAEIKIHRSFKVYSVKGDIALLKLDGMLIFTHYVKPICLLDRSADEELILNETGYMAGWGKDDRGAFSNQLKHVEMRIASRTNCATSDPNYKKFLSGGRFFCARFENGSSLITGHNGGGLYIKYERRWVLRGITSMGKINQTTGETDMSGYLLFTDVAHFQSWVINKIPIGDCGQRTGDFWSDERIWPWHAAVMHRTAGESPTYACAGTIISSSYILTAAQCIVEPVGEMRPKSGLSIRAGSNNLHDFDQFLQEIAVAETIIHEEFNNNYTFAKNDIALLNMERKLIFTSYVKAICLPSDRTFYYSFRFSDRMIVGKHPNGVFTGRWITIYFKSEGKTDAATINYKHNVGFSCLQLMRFPDKEWNNFGGGLYGVIGNRWILREIISNQNINQSGGTKASFKFNDVAFYLPWINDKTGMKNEDGVQYVYKF